MNMLMFVLMLVLHVNKWIYEYVNVVFNVSMTC